ncbi:amidohydrolase family protein [Mucilaginibacter myungsuensis]|uniref:Amidohydrolase family protein n=1 Tax=Mucilaginibacter myungsuensis TaxID=649104 RepID=A0A929KYQ4_9SPHI|nr:amidohydrolase family protein [Mucilaginibacter myungsuensis]MBE9664136.1 amidohydrolase family protein [Mucilaginibacter myungsuensis]MDN3601315.1 amidohydrolase family protein [Mucilaginibacter myungsuensis]
MKTLFFALAFFANLTSFAQSQKFDLMIKNANVFDSRTGKVLKGRTILIKSGIITEVTGSAVKYIVTKTIDAAGKLVSPGYIDTHIHPTDVFRSYGPLLEYLPKDSLDLYRQRITDTYLPYGITTGMIMGHSEKWLPNIYGWQNAPAADQLDLYTVGGAMVSNQTRTPYINHSMVNSPAEAKQKVLEYYMLGLKHIKLYWKLKRPEFEAAFKTADSLHMKVYAHVDQNVMQIDTALKIGVRNYEHALTLVNSVWDAANDEAAFRAEMKKFYKPGAEKNGQLERLEMFRFIHDRRPEAMNVLIDRLLKNKATLSTSIHLMAEPFGAAYLINKPDTSLNLAQLARCKENIKIFMTYVKQASDKGLTLRMGTDWPNGGQAFISEQLLLADHGFSTARILQIATINGATALGLDDRYGSVAKGKKADLLIWDKSPFDNAKNFSATKTIIKDGVVYAGKTVNTN